jgi:hypothetical protein
MTILLDIKIKELDFGGACVIGEQNEKLIKHSVQKTWKIEIT